MLTGVATDFTRKIQSSVLSANSQMQRFLKAYKTKETKGFFPYEWFDCPEKREQRFSSL